MSNMMRYRSQLPNLFDQFLTDWNQQETSLSKWMAYADIHETANEFIIKVDMPAVRKEDIQLSFENNVMTIQAKRHAEYDETFEGKVIRSERQSGECQRSFTLSKSIDVTSIKAKLENGVLTVTAQKTPDSISKAITID